MPEFNVAVAVICLLSRENFVGQPHLTEMQKLRRSAQAKS
jgi:hypothetical protein